MRARILQQALANAAVRRTLVVERRLKYSMEEVFHGDEHAATALVATPDICPAVPGDGDARGAGPDRQPGRRARAAPGCRADGRADHGRLLTDRRRRGPDDLDERAV